MDAVPAYVSVVFILTTFASIAFLLRSAKIAGLRTLPSQILILVLPLWIFFQAVLAVGGFYHNVSSVPPRMVLTGVAPAIIFLVLYLVFFRKFIEGLPL